MSNKQKEIMNQAFKELMALSPEEFKKEFEKERDNFWNRSIEYANNPNICPFCGTNKEDRDNVNKEQHIIDNKLGTDESHKNPNQQL